MKLLCKNTPFAELLCHSTICAILPLIALVFFVSSVRADDAPALRDSIPEAWLYQPEKATTLPSDDRWWEGFNDPVLTSLIERGEKNWENRSKL